MVLIPVISTVTGIPMCWCCLQEKKVLVRLLSFAKKRSMNFGLSIIVGYY